jgi:hypothetical protein
LGKIKVTKEREVVMLQGRRFVNVNAEVVIPMVGPFSIKVRHYKISCENIVIAPAKEKIEREMSWLSIHNERSVWINSFSGETGKRESCI